MGLPRAPGPPNVVLAADLSVPGCPRAWAFLAATVTVVCLALPFGAEAQDHTAPSVVSQGAQVEGAEGDDRERAVRLAREDRFDEALSILRELHAEDPTDVGLRADLAAVLNWAGMDREALEVGIDLPFEELDPVIAESVARSARNASRPSVAASIYRDVLASHPERRDAHIGLTLALREAGELEGALRTASELADRFSADPDAQMAAAHVFRDAGLGDRALHSYRIAAQARPADFESRRAIFHILADDRHFDEAEAVLEVFLDRHPDHLPALVTRATGWALAGNLAGAQVELERLKEFHPDDLSVRQELAAVYRWRGWARRSLAEYEEILALAPENETAHVGRTTALLDLDRRDEARRALAELGDLGMADEGTDDPWGLGRRLHIDGLWEFAFDAGLGRSSGGELGTRDHTLTSRLVSPPLADRVRVRIGTHREDARFEEGSGAHDRVSGGIEIRAGDVRLTAEGTGARKGERYPGLGTQLDLAAGDRLSLQLSGASHSVQVPLRAEPTGVRGWDARGRLVWRAHEARSWLLQGGVVEMSDGNRRRDAYAALEQSLVRRPGGDLGLVLEVYGASHDTDEVPYFSPTRMRSAASSLAWGWVPWGSGERRLRQDLVLTGGGVHQAHEDLLPMGAFRIEHDWSLGPTFALRYGGRWASPVYDGTRERRLSGHLGFTWRLP